MKVKYNICLFLGLKECSKGKDNGEVRDFFYFGGGKKNIAL
jgi:hypothetical protein